MLDSRLRWILVLLVGLFARVALSAEPAAGGFDVRRRVAWDTSRVVGRPEPPLPFRARRVFERLPLTRPLYVVREPLSRRLLVVQQDGRIWRFDADGDGSQPELFLHLKGQQAYGLTFHPQYEQNGLVYVVHNGPVGSPDKHNRVSRFTVSRQAPFACDPASERVILQWSSNGHDGGDLAFGPDGYLYITAGDGTSDSDTLESGQDLSNLLGTLIRIDVDHPDGDRPYSIPPDNPFRDLPGARPEIWAYGFRNPWRMTFDRRTGHCWVGNIGQDLWEMVHLVRRGENYGWSVMEGSQPFYPNRRRGPTPPVKPTIEHPHSEARSVTGGIVYYGSLFRELRGAYVYGDYATGKIWAARHDGTRLTFHREIADTSLQILGFGETPDGELLLVDYGGGLYTLERSPEEKSPFPFPRRLSETGLFLSVAEHRMHPALVPYSVNAPLWSDGAEKQRWIALPNLERIDFTPTGGWNFPDGAVLVKTFSLPMVGDEGPSVRRIETRLLTRQQGEWVGYSYEWNAEQTDAVLVGPAGADRDFAVPAAGGRVVRQTWRYPSRAECMVCHSRAANFVLGPSTVQMNRLHDYGGHVENQLRLLQRLGVFRVNVLDHDRQLQARLRRAREAVARLKERSVGGLSRRLAGLVPWKTPGRFAQPAMAHMANLLWREPRLVQFVAGESLHRLRQELAAHPRYTTLLPQLPAEYDRLVNPYDPRADLNRRARSYLHANCAMCHVRSGGGNAQMELDFSTAAREMNIFDVSPLHHTFGLPQPRLVAVGDPGRSVLLERVARRGAGQMPPLASALVDEQAVELLRAWILQYRPAEPETRRPE